MPKKMEQSSLYDEEKFASLKEANAYAKSNKFKWYTSTLNLKIGIDGVKQFAPGKRILVAMVGDTNVIYYK